MSLKPMRVKLLYDPSEVYYGLRTTSPLVTYEFVLHSISPHFPSSHKILTGAVSATMLWRLNDIYREHCC